eukprot:7367945-Pyramimonas_sp.AAC.1
MGISMHMGAAQAMNQMMMAIVKFTSEGCKKSDGQKLVVDTVVKGSLEVYPSSADDAFEMAVKLQSNIDFQRLLSANESEWAKNMNTLITYSKNVCSFLDVLIASRLLLICHSLLAFSKMKFMSKGDVDANSSLEP